MLLMHSIIDGNSTETLLRVEKCQV